MKNIRSKRSIIRYECDKPMADKKGFNLSCRKECFHCLCGIITYDSGEREHFAYTKEVIKASLRG